MELATVGPLASAILAGEQETSFSQALDLLRTSDADTMALLGWANQIRHHFRGNKIHVCAISNVKSGRCSEDCGFCAQSAHVSTGIREYGLLSAADIEVERQRAEDDGARAFGLVAAWKGLEEGPVLDAVCDRIRRVSKAGAPRADASLGIISEFSVAKKLREAGVHCYNHNLETSPSYFGEICQTHTFEDRLKTIEHCREAGMKICSGGIIGMGESLEHRVELAFELKKIAPDIVPLNFFNPIEGTELVAEKKYSHLTPLECLRTIAMFRFVMPRSNIMVAGGREVNLRELQSYMFTAGASATMVGSYLTTSGRDAKQDMRLIAELGLEPTGDL